MLFRFRPGSDVGGLLLSAPAIHARGSENSSSCSTGQARRQKGPGGVRRQPGGGLRPGGGAKLSRRSAEEAGCGTPALARRQSRHQRRYYRRRSLAHGLGHLAQAGHRVARVRRQRRLARLALGGDAKEPGNHDRDVSGRGCKGSVGRNHAAPNYGPDYIKNFDKIYTDLAQEHHLPFLPFLLVDIITKDLHYLQRDGIHPTAEGAEIVSGTVFRTLKPLL